MIVHSREEVNKWAREVTSQVCRFQGVSLIYIPLSDLWEWPLLRQAGYSSSCYKLLLQAMALCQSRSVAYKIYLAHEEGVLTFQIRSGINCVCIVLSYGYLKSVRNCGSLEEVVSMNSSILCTEFLMTRQFLTDAKYPVIPIQYQHPI